MVCYDTTSDVAALIEKGVIEFAIGLEPLRQARILADTIYAYLVLGQQPESFFIETPISVAFDKNIGSLLNPC